MSRVNGGSVECDGCGHILEGTLRDSVIIHRANYDLGRVEILHLCLVGVEGEEPCAPKIEPHLRYYNSKEENNPKRSRPEKMKRPTMPRSKKAPSGRKK